MSLIAAGTGAAPDEPETLENNGFWPAIAPRDFRDATRLDGTVTAPRLVQALQVAMADVNRQLADWQQDKQDEGAQTLADVTPPAWAIAGHYALLYRRAVYATAHASLLERYRDVSATEDGDERGEAKDHAADDIRRDARWAVAEIEGRQHTTVELI
ncbi:head completion/stabilization protein [Chromohalobacter israelensis]|uniref:head completion/stabilization protein n=1 Tax=Chromohalobacter israelensis TaxID=141390 RepID=UPI001CC65239|nr:head completion/stabilization protein [Chromohalobacter salexigens]MBZ5876018.1 head completion/stabilization protein [Chromohalobacter salexigens]